MTHTTTGSFRRRGLTLLEAAIATAVLALLLALAFTTLRSSGLQVATSTVENRLEQAMLRVLGALRDDLRRASLASVVLEEPHPVYGAQRVRFRKILALDPVSGAPILAAETTSYGLDPRRGFIRSEAGRTSSIAGFAPPGDDAAGPGLSFHRAPGGLVRFTVRFRSVDAATGAPVTRARSGSVKVLNP